jgi:redox-sensitive bicupin YhaK (pirin superfamily)
MTRLDADPGEVVLHDTREPAVSGSSGPRALLLESREVPLGGVRAMSVHRSLPQRDLPLVGAWCFLDRFGPQVTRMRVEPHPHIGLQTVTWPFEGDIRHRDSVGNDVLLGRGALNLMTSGAGISHSEYSVGEVAVPLDALQLWVALPESRRHGGPAFERHAQLPSLELPALAGAAVHATVVLGELGGVTSPASVYTPIVGAEIRLSAGSRVQVPLRPEWEYAIVGVEGVMTVTAGIPSTDPAVELDRRHLLYLGSDRRHVEIAAEEDALLFLLGGEPFEDDVVMWWNFVGRTHEEIVEAREAWESGAPRFGHVVDHGDERVPAPPLPGVRLTRRRRRI